MNTSGPIELDVLPVQQPIGEFYIASIPAKTLVSISFADVRRMTDEQREIERYLGIQRPLSMSRAKEIRKYIAGSDATFPTAIILAIEERCATFDRTTNKLRLEPFNGDEDSDDAPIPRDKIAKILDGQHRIAAFLNDQKEWCTEFDGIDFKLNVAIFVGADISEQANIFATVNLAQTKVNRSLVYDLTELARTRSPHKTCHIVAVSLDSEAKSPLHRRIKRLGTATPNRKHEPLTQAVFVESLVRFISIDPVQDRNNLLDGKRLKLATREQLMKTPFRNLFIDKADLDIAEIIYNYFCAVRSKWPKSWDALDKTGNLLPKSNAFKALMKFLKEDVYLACVGDDIGRIPTVKEFASHFKLISLKDEDFTTRNFAPGSGGQSTFLKMLRREITLTDMIE